jgi:hypothetical protein
MKNFGFPISLTALLLGMGLHSLRAQSYSIDSFTIAGGGGTSTGGLFAVSGTIGQPDAGAMSGGNYSLAGGFWGVVNVIQIPGAPLLSVEQLSGGNMRVYWPLPAEGFVLDQTSGLAGPPAAISWSQVTFPYQTNATQISVTVAPSGNKFYRLRHP